MVEKTWCDCLEHLLLHLEEEESQKSLPREASELVICRVWSAGSSERGTWFTCPPYCIEGVSDTVPTPWPRISPLIWGRSSPCWFDGGCSRLIDVNLVISHTTWAFETAGLSVVQRTTPSFEMLCQYKNSCSYWLLNSFLCSLCDKLPSVGHYFSDRADFSWCLGITSCSVREMSSLVSMSVAFPCLPSLYFQNSKG